MPVQSAAKKQPRIVMVCNTCGSEDVRLDAWAGWDTDGQRWELAQTFDYAHCENCEGECRIVEKYEA